MKIKRRNWFQRFWLRFTIARTILFKEKHIVVIFATEEQIINIIKDNELKPDDEINWSYAGMSLDISQRLLKIIGNNIDENEIICNKACWTAEVTELLKAKNEKRTDKNN